MRLRTLAATAALALASVLAAGCAGTQGSAGPSARPSSGATSIPSNPGHARLTLSETGSTLLYPLFQAWAPAYHQAFPSISITSAATGSGAGIQDASDGSADIGASDAFLSSGNLVLNPNLLNIPLAISAQQVNYNVPGLKPGTHIRLNGTILAEIYSGLITNWRSHAIQALNPGVPLPSVRIVPLHREDSSGDTFLFTSYLSTDDPSWNSKIGYGTTVAWPSVPGGKAETGNSGMVAGCAATRGCIAYIGISYLTTALQDHLGEAELQNTAGRFLLPNGPSMLAAVSSFVPATPANETISMVNGPASAGYPIVNYEYAIISRHQPSAAKARALKAFLHWAITSGNAASFLDQVRFEQLPPEVVKLADAQIAEIR